jgi:hypothetical protein
MAGQLRGGDAMKTNVIPMKPKRNAEKPEKPMGPIVQLVFDAAYDLLDEANGRSVRGGQIAKRVGEPICIVARCSTISNDAGSSTVQSREPPGRQRSDELDRAQTDLEARQPGACA